VLKSIFLVDIFTIGFGFIYRAFAGIVAIDVRISPWFLLTTFLAALLLATGKRYTELQQINNPAQTRTSLDNYSEDLITFILFSVITTLLVAYSIYTFFSENIYMMSTIPFAFYAAFRYIYLLYDDALPEPYFLFYDRPAIANFSLWGITLITSLYFPDIVGGVI
jgi:4-hydroxybenzoate polyprenyltransferase